MRNEVGDSLANQLTFQLWRCVEAGRLLLEIMHLRHADKRISLGTYPQPVPQSARYDPTSPYSAESGAILHLQMPSYFKYLP